MGKIVIPSKLHPIKSIQEPPRKQKKQQIWPAEEIAKAFSPHETAYQQAISQKQKQEKTYPPFLYLHIQKSEYAQKECKAPNDTAQ